MHGLVHRAARERVYPAADQQGSREGNPARTRERAQLAVEYPPYRRLLPGRRQAANRVPMHERELADRHRQGQRRRQGSSLQPGCPLPCSEMAAACLRDGKNNCSK